MSVIETIRRWRQSATPEPEPTFNAVDERARLAEKVRLFREQFGDQHGSQFAADGLTSEQAADTYRKILGDENAALVAEYEELREVLLSLDCGESENDPKLNRVLRQLRNGEHPKPPEKQEPDGETLFDRHGSFVKIAGRKYVDEIQEDE